jgi:NAD(P)-dependent dehydrogenase (short-subunit alcohol dehydrogenase family)
METRDDGRRTALVTGGNRGIGLEVCRQLGRAGLDVVLGARDAAAGEEAAAALRLEGLAVRALRLDVARRESVQEAAAVLVGQGVQVDVLVNNAGVLGEAGLLDSTSGEWEAHVGVNLLGPAWTCQVFVPPMVRAGYGRVVNVSSGWGSFHEGLGGPAPYSITKAALNALTVTLAREVRR